MGWQGGEVERLRCQFADKAVVYERPDAWYGLEVLEACHGRLVVPQTAHGVLVHVLDLGGLRTWLLLREKVITEGFIAEIGLKCLAQMQPNSSVDKSRSIEG